MNYEDVQKVSNAAKAKSNLVNTNFFKYFIRAVMAGFFISITPEGLIKYYIFILQFCNSTDNSSGNIHFSQFSSKLIHLI